jgi:hypothetical protein
MLGLAKLMGRVAYKRVWGYYPVSGWLPPLCRDRVINAPNSASAEYYRICDRIARGEKP